MSKYLVFNTYVHVLYQAAVSSSAIIYTINYTSTAAGRQHYAYIYVFMYAVQS